MLEGFFGSKTDVFDKFLLPEFELQLEIRSAKIVILPRENAVFYKKRHFCSEVGIDGKHEKNVKKLFRNQVVFSH